MKRMKRMIWCGDAAVDSGFARCTHKILDVTKETWDVAVLGLNYQGDPHGYPYYIFPCWPGGDAFGLNRLVELCEKISPDLIVVQNDPWNVPAYLQRAGNVPVVAIMPVDGKNCKGREINGLTTAIFWTEFGKLEAQRGGYTGETKVIPLGVDTDVYRFIPDSRKKLGLPSRLKDSFIVGNVNRNQPRKRLDLTIDYFCEWVKNYDVDDAYLFLHVAPTGDVGYDVSQLMYYYGLSNRLIIVEPPVNKGVNQKTLAATYSCFDVQLSTTQGEGWGLTTMEGMSCSVPQIVPNWSALGEWAKDAAVLIPCTTNAVTPNNINIIGGIPDKHETIKALNGLYQDKEKRFECGKRGFDLVTNEKFRWENIGQQFTDVFNSINRRSVR